MSPHSSTNVSSKEIDRNIGAIVRASSEQAIALQEINTAVNTLDQGTQQNAAMVEVSTAASRALVQEVNRIAQMLGEFSIGVASAKTASHNTRRSGPAPANPLVGLASPTRGHSIHK